MAAIGKKIVVVGTSGCGKSTLARQIAHLIKAPSIELDSLHWEPNWVEAPDDVFRARVIQSLKSETWVVDGNYGKIRDVVWPLADTVVWLDYSLMRILWQLLWRTMERLIFKRELWSGNTESWRTQFFSRDSLFLWAWRTWPKHRSDYPLLFKLQEFQHLSLIRLRNPSQTRQWLASADFSS